MRYFFENEYNVRDEVPEQENIIEDFQLEDEAFVPALTDVLVEDNPYREQLYLSAELPVIKQA